MIIEILHTLLGISSDSDAKTQTLEERPLWRIALEIGASVPDEELDKLPRDLSKNLDHYLYAAPKEKQ